MEEEKMLSKIEKGRSNATRSMIAILSRKSLFPTKEDGRNRVARGSLDLSITDSL